MSCFEVHDDGTGFSGDKAARSKVNRTGAGDSWRTEVQTSCNSAVSEMRKRQGGGVHPDVPTFRQQSVTQDLCGSRTSIDPDGIAAIRD
jgi:hypothetical protein